MTEIRVDGLTKRFGDTVALDDVSVEIPQGEFVIIMGVSGSGKSTLLRCIGGLLEPTEGSIRIDGRPAVGDDDAVAFIFQQHNLIEEMTAYSNALSGALGRNGFSESLSSSRTTPKSTARWRHSTPSASSRRPGRRSDA